MGCHGTAAGNVSLGEYANVETGTTMTTTDSPVPRIASRPKKTEDATDEFLEIAPGFRRVDTGRTFPKARLKATTTTGYLLLAAEIDRRPMLLPNSRRKNRLLRRLRILVQALKQDPRVVEANLFDGLIDTPGRGEVVKHDGAVRPARFDVVVLIEATSPETAESLEEDSLYVRVRRLLEASSEHTYWLQATNIRSMGPVDHSRPGVFLFNFFYATRTDLNLAAWQYTAGWFWDQTGLDNSRVLLPLDSSEPKFRLVNHARWDRLRDVLPALVFKRTFRTYVLAHFTANGVAAQPGLYRLVA
jgi:hypothetical protein